MAGGRVAGKVALVTGGGSGLGAAICSTLAAEGASVIVSDRNEQAARAVAEPLPSAVPFRLDVASEDEWRSAASFVAERFGTLDILVNNAGVLSSGNAEDVELDHFRWVNAIMSEGVFLGCKHAMPLLRRAPSASIINISSTAALRGYAGFLAYTAAKGAVRAMTKAIAVAAQDRGDRIRCNSIHPGDIETPMQQAYDRRAARDVPDGVLPRGAVGAPGDVAAMALFLAADESRFATGAEFIVDNGATARSGW